MKLRKPAVFSGIRPVSVPEGATVRVIARRTDGSIEPLLWLRNYQSRWRRTYTFREPVRLERGAVIEASPPGPKFWLLWGGL